MIYLLILLKIFTFILKINYDDRLRTLEEEEKNNVTFMEEENVLELDRDNLCIGLGQNKTIDENTVNFNWNTLLKGKFYINNTPLQDLIEQFEWYDVIE